MGVLFTDWVRCQSLCALPERFAWKFKEQYSCQCNFVVFIIVAVVIRGTFTTDSKIIHRIWMVFYFLVFLILIIFWGLYLVSSWVHQTLCLFNLFDGCIVHWIFFFLPLTIKFHGAMFFAQVCLLWAKADLATLPDLRWSSWWSS